MIQKIVLLILLSFIIVSCKTSQSTSVDSNEIVLLLQDEVKPSELLAFNDIEIVDQKRTSRSQNQWMIKLNLNENQIRNLKEQLLEDSKVLKVISTEPSENENFSNN